MHSSIFIPAIPKLFEHSQAFVIARAKCDAVDFFHLILTQPESEHIDIVATVRSHTEPSPNNDCANSGLL
jgi:hypothetical protein